MIASLVLLSVAASTVAGDSIDAHVIANSRLVKGMVLSDISSTGAGRSGQIYANTHCTSGSFTAPYDIDNPRIGIWSASWSSKCKYIQVLHWGEEDGGYYKDAIIRLAFGDLNDRWDDNWWPMQAERAGSGYKISGMSPFKTTLVIRRPADAVYHLDPRGHWLPWTVEPSNREVVDLNIVVCPLGTFNHGSAASNCKYFVHDTGYGWAKYRADDRTANEFLDYFWDRSSGFPTDRDHQRVEPNLWGFELIRTGAGQPPKQFLWDGSRLMGGLPAYVWKNPSGTSPEDDEYVQISIENGDARWLKGSKPYREDWKWERDQLWGMERLVKLNLPEEVRSDWTVRRLSVAEVMLGSCPVSSAPARSGVELADGSVVVCTDGACYRTPSFQQQDLQSLGFVTAEHVTGLAAIFGQDEHGLIYGLDDDGNVVQLTNDASLLPMSPSAYAAVCNNLSRSAVSTASGPLDSDSDDDDCTAWELDADTLTVTVRKGGNCGGDEKTTQRLTLPLACA